MDPRYVDIAHPSHDGVVDDDDVDRRARDPVAVDQHRQADGDDAADEPAGPTGAQVTGQRRRGSRRAPPRGPPPETASTVVSGAADVDSPRPGITTSLTTAPPRERRSARK